MSPGIERDPDKRIDSDRGTYDIEHDGVSADERQSGTAGLPTKDNVPPETMAAIDSDRTERLDPANRPDDAEVDNTQREFDPEAGLFTDSEGYDRADKPFAADEVNQE